MILSARLRSLVALMVLVLLFGVPAVPLALCASDARQMHCTDDTLRQAAKSHGGCDKPDAPAATLSCYCSGPEAPVPSDTSAATNVASTALSVAASPGDAVVPQQEVRSAPAIDAVRTRHRPLFTLFSAFLI